jgi:3-(3-hydroxy-phenyl)propionate hydroxylase
LSFIAAMVSLVAREPAPKISDDALGGGLALVGFGCDPAARLSPCLQKAWARAGGGIVRLRHRGQSGKREGSWEDMTGCLTPGAAPVGWIAVVRPDRTVMHDGPLEQLDSIVRESLSLIKAEQPIMKTVLHTPMVSRVD